MEPDERLDRMEASIQDLKCEVAVIKSNYARREDLRAFEASITANMQKWLLGVVGLQLAVAVAFWFR